MMLLLGCVCHECMSVVYAFVMHVDVYMLLCMHCHGYGFACIIVQRCIVMVIVVVLCHHDVIGFYDANVLAEIEQEMQTIRVRLQH